MRPKTRVFITFNLVLKRQQLAIRSASNLESMNAICSGRITAFVLKANWQGISTVVRATGTPLAIPASNLTGAAGCTSYVPAGGQTNSHWINNNESCYQTLNQWQTRTAPLLVGYLRNPGYVIWNQSLQKTFVLGWEGTSAKFGIDCYLCSNTPIWGAPDGAISNVPTPSSTGLTGFGTIAPTNHQVRNLLVSLKIMF